ncbi:hypothetical protein F5B18DRAFT_28282 [Nemania serpens]|nr:hypothetical protein F5B18DRAFT_28282 [Nemania serpens]
MFSTCPHSLQNRCTKPKYRREMFRITSCGNLSHATLVASPRLAKSCSSSDLYRQTSASFPIRIRHTGVSKAREPRNNRSSQSRSPPSNKGDGKNLSATSLVSSFIATPSSSCPSHVDRYEEPDTNYCQPLDRQAQITAEVQLPGCSDDEYAPGVWPSRQSNTEYEANLAAASDETRPLFIEYYKRTYGDNYVEEEDTAHTYWKWNQDRQQWHHKNEDTGSEAWFLGLA